MFVGHHYISITIHASLNNYLNFNKLTTVLTLHEKVVNKRKNIFKIPDWLNLFLKFSVLQLHYSPNVSQLFCFIFKYSLNYKIIIGQDAIIF